MEPSKELIELKEVADRLSKSQNTIRGYLRDGLLVWHQKDERTGVKVLFYWPCVQVRQDLVGAFRNNGKNRVQMREAFEQFFGKKDQKLIAFLENHHSTERAITNFKKIFAEKGLL